MLNPFKAIKSFFQRPIIISKDAGTGISANYYSGDGNYGSGAKYPGGMSASKTVILHNHREIRQRARDAMYDSPEARALVKSVVDTVVDSGMRLKPTPIAEILGITPEAAEEWAEDVAQKYHLWAVSKKSHRSRVNNYYQNQRLYQLFKQRDGDVFVRLYYTREWDTVSPLQIDFVDPNQIRGCDFTSTYYQPNIDDGIIRDAGGREVGYKVWNINKLGEYIETDIPARGEKSGRYFMLHGYTPEYAGQGRGYSAITHLLQEFEKLTDFKAATIQKAIEQASLVMAIENEHKDASNPFEGRAAGPIREYNQPLQADTPPATGTDSEPIVNYTAIPEATHTQPGVGVFNLRDGDKINYLKDTSPSTEFDAFTSAFFASICASTGYSIETVLKKFSNNYSASRATLILCYRVACTERLDQNSDFDNPIYEMWLSEEIAAGRVTAPGFSDPYLRAAWLCAEWDGSQMPNIDPLKQMQADKLAVELSAETLDDVARNHNGSSGKANRAKLTRQYSELPEPPWGWVPGKIEDQQNNNNQVDTEDE